MFTPPPSPLPPRHSFSCDKTDDECGDENNQTPPPVSVKRSHRRLLILFFPVALLLIASASTTLSSPFDDGGSIPGLRPRDHVVPPSALEPHSVILSHAHVHQSGLGRATFALHTLKHIARQAGFIESPDSLDELTLPSSSSLSGSLLPTPTVKVLAPSSSAAPSIPTPALPLPTPFPQPWDTALSYNFTTNSCLSFFTDTLANNSFRSCRPFGMLLGYSSAFFQAEMDLTQLTTLVAGTCNTTQTADECVAVMDSLSTTMQQEDVCAIDLQDQNVMAHQALNGFRTYSVMRKAGCLVNARTNAYCFVEALAAPVPSDVYYYSLPLGTPIPKSTVPSCSTCVQSVLGLYEPLANDTSLYLADTYESAAETANSQCGVKYATTHNQTAIVPSKSGSSQRVMEGTKITLAVALVLGFMGGIACVL